MFLANVGLSVVPLTDSALSVASLLTVWADAAPAQPSSRIAAARPTQAARERPRRSRRPTPAASSRRLDADALPSGSVERALQCAPEGAEGRESGGQLELGQYPRLGSARLGSARLGSARLGSARLGSARLGSARLGSARLGSARLGSARLGSALNYIVGSFFRDERVQKHCHSMIACAAAAARVQRSAKVMTLHLRCLRPITSTPFETTSPSDFKSNILELIVVIWPRRRT